LRILSLIMNKPACPACTLEDVLTHPQHWECATCGHEWAKEEAPEAPRVVKDAHGNTLVDGDTVTLIKDLKFRGGSGVLKGGTKARSIRLVDGDHEIDCKIDGVPMALKACFVKKS
jgi:protein PhnA